MTSETRRAGTGTRLVLGERWLGLELRHLAALKAIAHEGSFRRAAMRLGYTQSAISQQLAALERVTGATLVERNTRQQPVTLTKAGIVLLEHAEAITARLVAARADVASAGEEVGTLHVGTYQSVGAHVLPLALKEFGRRRPDVEIRLTESNSDEELVTLVETGEIDLTFAVLPLREGPFEYREVLRDPYVLLVPEDSELGRRRGSVRPADIKALDVIGFRECASVMEAEAQLRAAAFEPKIVFRSNDNGTVLGLVAAGVGVAFVPQLVYQPPRSGIVALDLGSYVQPRVLTLVWHRDRRYAVALHEFAGVVAEVGGAIECVAGATRRA